MWKKAVEPASHRWQYNVAHAHCMLNTLGYKHTLRICNTCCFSTATMVARKRLSVTLYVLGLSSFSLRKGADTAPIKAVPWLWRLVAVLSSRRTCFDPSSVHMRFDGQSSTGTVFFLSTLSLSFQQCSILFSLVLLLSGQASETWGLSNTAKSFWISRIIGQKSNFALGLISCS